MLCTVIYSGSYIFLGLEKNFTMTQYAGLLSHSRLRDLGLKYRPTVQANILFIEAMLLA